MRLGEKIDNYLMLTTKGEQKLYDMVEESWFALFSHPADFTPVCTTELAKLDDLDEEFKKRKVKVLCSSTDSVKIHNQWKADIKCLCKNRRKELSFDLISDESRDMAIGLGMLDPAEKSSKGLPLACRAVLIFGPEKTLLLSLLYPATTGRNFDEILRVIDSLKLTKEQKLATPADWKVGDECIVSPNVSNDEAKKMFDYRVRDLPSKKDYIRYVTKYN